MRPALIVLVAAIFLSVSAQAGEVITIGPGGSGSYQTPDFSPLTKGYTEFGEGISRGLEALGQRQREDEAKDVLAKVLAAGLKGFNGIPAGPEAALAAAVENPAALDHPRFTAIIRLIEQRAR